MDYMKVDGVKIVGFYSDEIIEHMEEIERYRDNFIPISSSVKHKIIDDANWQLVDTNIDKYSQITMDLFYNYFVNIPTIPVEPKKTELDILKEQMQQLKEDTDTSLMSIMKFSSALVQENAELRQKLEGGL